MDIEKFIETFKKDGNEKSLEEHFTCGYCYHFAVILAILFGGKCGSKHIMYNPVENHFAVKIKNKLYDITGEIIPNEHWYNWEQYKHFEPLDSKRVIEQCVYKKEIENE